MDRREFLICGAAAVGMAGCRTLAPTDEPRRILFGACRGKPNEVAVMKELGYDFWEGHVGTVFGPEKDDAWWREQKTRLQAYALPLRACNGFIPGTYRLTGPKAEHEPALVYAETALRRAEELGVTAIVFGSGGARNVPGDLCGEKDLRPDPEQGAAQYAAFCAELARRVADLKTTTVVLEPLRPKETNIVNYVWQAEQIVRDIASPRVKTLADIFHMMMGREGAESLRFAGADLVHCHVAAYGTRDFPGAQPETVARLKPYCEMLRAIGYAGGVSCECGWGDTADLRKNLHTALTTLKGLLS